MTSQIAALHYSLTLLVLILGFAAFLRGLILLARWRDIGGIGVAGEAMLRWLLISCGAVAFIVALLGMLLLAHGTRPSDSLHYLWGLIAAAAIPLAARNIHTMRFRREVVVLTLIAAAVVAGSTLALFSGCPYLGGCPH